MKPSDIVIVAAKRTAHGKMLGCFSTLTASELASYAITAAIQQANLQPSDIQQTLLGCVLPAGQGQAPARQAAIAANIPNTSGATSINKMCGSGMQAVMFAHDMLLANTHDIILAGGMESMTNAPYLLPNARQGYRLGHAQLMDHMFLDGLEDAYDKGKLMGLFAEETAKEYKISREQQDEFAMRSLIKAKQASDDGTFANEIVPITVQLKKQTITIDKDEQPQKADPNRIATLSPVFTKDGTITAANASSIADGASALILMREDTANKMGLRPLAKIIGHANAAKAPQEFTTAPIDAIQALLTKIDWDINSVDLFEINEAFAVVTLAAMQELKIPQAKVNIFGGACAFGHPIGSSGSRILVTLINALQKTNNKRGVASLCIGGGEANAVAIEILK